MTAAHEPIRVLHSFPHRLGKARICTTAWYEIESAARAGAELKVMAGDSVRELSPHVALTKTMAAGRMRVPASVVGTRRACALHDWLVARALSSLAGSIDVVHAWPLAARRTIEAAHRLGIPVALERCNAHTRFAFDVVARESARIGVELPPNHEHAYNETTLRLEEEEYAQADALLCPSEFVVRTFRDAGYPPHKLARFIYGVDEQVFHARGRPARCGAGLRAIFVGVCAVRKGLHFALEAWRRSTASRQGEFLIAGDFLPDYRRALEPLLGHPSVRILGHRSDVAQLMRECDVFVMPSIEEGFGLVCTEAMASGAVPLVSDACTELCVHDRNALVHRVADVDTLTRHLDTLDQDRGRLERLRQAGLDDLPSMTWDAAGRSLVAAYRRIVDAAKSSSPRT